MASVVEKKPKAFVKPVKLLEPAELKVSSDGMEGKGWRKPQARAAKPFYSDHPKRSSRAGGIIMFIQATVSGGSATRHSSALPAR